MDRNHYEISWKRHRSAWMPGAMFREIRIDNNVTNNNGDEVSLKRGGAHQQVTIEAEKESAIPASNSTPETLGDY
jgi:hypothetical protein